VQIDALPTSFLECRTIGHAWTIRWWGNVKELPSDLVPEIVSQFRWDLVRVSTCLRCHTIRDEFYPQGRNVDRFRCQYRRYRYPDGYQVSGHGVPARALFSKTAYERWTSGESFLR
jgi:hypothetical protein